MEKVIVYTNPTSLVTEAYRAFCTNVLAELGDKKLMEVVGLNEKGDASLVTANLAVAMAQASKKVLVIDCNLRHPIQHELFGLPNKGLMNVLDSADKYTIFVQQTVQQNLQVLTAGAEALNPVETLLSDAMQNLLSEVKSAYDVIILDVPAVGIVSDAVALGTKTDGVLLVLTKKEDKLEQAQKAKDIFKQAGVNILGCLLDKV